MKRIWIAVLAALPLLALPGPAHAWCPCGAGTSAPPCSGSIFQFRISFCNYGCGCNIAGPWYSYWPYEAHFQAPPPIGGCYPYWPTATEGAAAGMPVTPGTPTPAVTPAPAPAPAPTTQPAAYYGQPPAYWYQR